MQFIKTISDSNRAMDNKKTSECLGSLQVGQWYDHGSSRRVYLGSIAGIPQYEEKGPRLRERMKTTRAWTKAWNEQGL